MNKSNQSSLKTLERTDRSVPVVAPQGTRVTSSPSVRPVMLVGMNLCSLSCLMAKYDPNWDSRN